MEDFVNKVNSIDAIEKMINNNINVYALIGLHTKLYLFDNTDAVIGSANFTSGGLKTNVELSLHINDEQELISELNQYFDNLLDQIYKSDEGKVTQEIIDKAREKYIKVFSSKKGSGNVTSTYMYGAKTDKTKSFITTDDFSKEFKKCIDDKDVIYEMFMKADKRKLIEYKNSIWMKFGGEGNDRIEGKYEPTHVNIDRKEVYISCYPETKKPTSVREDDYFYMAALSYDKKGKAQPMIIGRGKLSAFHNSRIIDSWIENYPWMIRYPWYCIIKEMTIMDTDVENGLPLDQVLDKFGSDTYMSSFGRNESIADVSKKHHQKAHIRISGNAKEFIDMKLNELENKYLCIKYKSEF